MIWERVTIRNGVYPFKAEDMLYMLETGIKEFGVKCIPTDQMKDLAMAREDNGQCVTGWVEDEIVGCGGIDLIWPGVGEVWLFLSYDVDKYPIKAYVTIKDGLEKLIKDNDLTRCQAWGRIKFDRAHTLFKHLGFKPEGIAEKYMPDGTDAILYARIK